MKTTYWISLIFGMNASLGECKKVAFFSFQENLKIGHFGRICPNLEPKWSKKWRFFQEKSKIGHFGPSMPKTVQNGHFWPKMTKMEVFAFFSRTAHQNFLIFGSKHSHWSLKIITFSLFGENFKNSPFWPKLTQIWPNLAKLAGCWNIWNSLKNLKVGVFETYFKQVPFVFRQTTCTYSESRVGEGAKKMTKKPKFGSKIFSP